LLVNPTGDRSVRLRPSLSLADDELHESIIRIKNSID